MSDVKRNSHCPCQINYHFVSIPRYRKKVLTGAIAERLRPIRTEIAAEFESDILTLQVMPGHIHLFVSCPPKWLRAEIVQQFKKRSSPLMMRAFSQLK